MHEMSLVRSLVAQIRPLIAANGGGTLRQVRVQVGPLSCVEPALLASAWDQSQDTGSLGLAVLEIEEVPLIARCRTCDAEFQPVQFRFHCPACGGTQTDAIWGDGVILHSIVLDDAEQGATA